HDLRQAIEADRILPYFQPTVDLSTGRVLSFEAIPRWIDPVQGEIPLQRFIPIAEENGLIHDLFAGVLGHACEAAAQWPEDVTLALDIYPGQLKDKSLRQTIIGVLQAAGLPPSRLELEITESALVSNL